MSDWQQTLSDQSGKTVLITGANGDLGAEVARQLAARGARIVLACRNTTTAQAVAGTLPGDPVVESLDLSSQQSVRDFADRYTGRIDTLINNAGIMMVPWSRTPDGFESTFGTNHLGHFALTGLLLDRIRERIVTVSSGAHTMATRKGLSDPNFHNHRYDRRVAYANSKMANLLFARELQRRLSAAGSPVLSVAAHPGVVMTGLYDHTESRLFDSVKFVGNLIAGSVTEGANPIVLAAAGSAVRGGEFYGPRYLSRGRRPATSPSTRLSRDHAEAERLWAYSEEQTGVRYLETAGLR
ncbi:oxidoreductase [Jongsikchunia kroppenstedtii]|uniref:oxidoreductase n=1 Tax=Jongsikchunia kroppenstedtii TaxID=1121721 RepID=UPI00037645A2|nr:oxidoreductase [Jongsikchunia kroppenstedtii]